MKKNISKIKLLISDVDGVCTTDPNMEKSARVIENIHYEETGISQISP